MAKKSRNRYTRGRISYFVTRMSKENRRRKAGLGRVKKVKPFEGFRLYKYEYIYTCIRRWLACEAFAVLLRRFFQPLATGYTSMFDCVIRESKRKCMVVQRRGLAKWFRMVTRCIYGWLSCSMPRFLVIRYGMKTDMASILDGHRRERESNFEERCIRRKERRGVGGEPEIKWCALSIAIWFGRRNSSVRSYLGKSRRNFQRRSECG